MSAIGRARTFRYATTKPLVNEVFKLANFTDPSPTSHSIATSGTWIATGYGSRGNVTVLPLDYSTYTRASDAPQIGAHSQDVSDLVFSPFDDNILATSGTEGSVKLWNIPTGGLKQGAATNIFSYDSFDNVNQIKFHPTASGVLGVAHKQGISVLDIATSQLKYSFNVEGNAKDILSLSWSHNGQYLAHVSRNNLYGIMDPRTAQDNVLTTASTTTIKKPHHMMWIGTAGKDENFIVTGLGSSQKPVMHFYDWRNPTKIVLQHDLDYSNGYTLPMYDRDTNLLFFTCRGSSVLSLFDVEQEKGKAICFGTHSYSCDAPFKGACLISKRAVKTNDSEVQRVMLLGQESITPYSIQVPRKLGGFHEELYPWTIDTKPAATADEYYSGENKIPILMSMVNWHHSKQVSKPVDTTPKDSPKSGTSSSKTDEIVQTKPNPYHVVKEEKKVEEVKTYQPTLSRKQLDSKFKKSIFQHANGKEPADKQYSFFDLKLGNPIALSESIQVNNKFFAVPWKCSGGSAIAIFALSQLGRARIEQPCVRGHKSPATSFDWNHYNDEELASGSGEGSIIIWRIPSTGLTSDMNEGIHEFHSQGKIIQLKYHPSINHVLVAATSTYDEHFVEFYDTHKMELRFTLNVHPEPIIDIAFEQKGAWMATTCRDGKARIIDIHSKRVLKTFSFPESHRDSRILFVAPHPNLVITTGFGAGSTRTASLWDIADDLSKPLATVELERVNYTPIPRYDEDTRILYIANSGGVSIQLYSVSPVAPHFELLNNQQSDVECTGLVFQSKHRCDVRKVEIGKAYKLTNTACLPITYSLLRKRAEFFQDDVYPPTRAEEPVMTTEDFFSGRYPQGKEPRYVSLKPADMQNLSEAPEEELTERQKKYQEELARQNAPKAKGILGHTSAEETRQYFRGVAAHLKPGSNRWDAKQDNSKVDVDEDEWA